MLRKDASASCGGRVSVPARSWNQGSPEWQPWSDMINSRMDAGMESWIPRRNDPHRFWSTISLEPP